MPGKTDRSVAYNWPGHCGIWNREFPECGRMPKGYGYFYLSSWAFIWRKSLDLDCS